MSTDRSSIEQLWQERYNELEETFSLAMTAIAEGMGRHAGPVQGEGIHDVRSVVSSASRVEVVATLSGPPQDVAFRVTEGSTVVHDCPFTRSNTLVFVPPRAGRFLVTCTSRALGTGIVLSQKSLEVLVG